MAISTPDTSWPEQAGPQRSLREKTRISTLDDDQLARLIEKDANRMRNHSGKWRKKARECYDFYAGDQWDDEDEAKLREALRPVITYNRVQPMIDAVVGLEVNNRQETRYLPRQIGDAGVSEVLTGAAEWARDECDAEDEETDAFLDTLTCGMGWTETTISYDEDVDGKLCVHRVDPIEMYWDTGSKKRNLADAKKICRIKAYDEDDFANEFPDWHDKITASTGAWDDDWTDRGDEPHFNDEIGYQTDTANTGLDSTKRVYFVKEYQWWELVPFVRTVNPATGQIEEVSPEAAARLRPMLEAEGIPQVRQKRRRYYRAFVASGKLLEKTELPVQTGFTYQCITGKRDRNGRYWTGLVQQLIDPQRWANKFFSQILHVLNTNAKGGILAEQTAFVDPDEAESLWAAPDSIVYVGEGALSGPKPKIMPKPTAQYPTGTDRLMEFSLAAFREVTGLNLEIMGQADRVQPGVLEYQRKESAVTILAPIFDSLKRYRKMQGRILLDYIQNYLSDGRLVRILGGDGAEKYIPLVRQADTIRYDIIVDDAPTSPNQKERVFQVLQVLLPALLKAGIPMPPEILDYAPIPSVLAAKWKQMLQPSPEAERPDPKMIEAQGKVMQSQAKAQLDQAKAGTEQAKQQTEVAKAQGIQSQAAAQMARIAEMTPVDQAQAGHFAAKEMLERQRAETERIRQQVMLAEAEAGINLTAEKEDTEEARQMALRRRPTNATG